MKINNKSFRTIWFENNIVKIIDQTKLPHQFIIKDLKSVKDSINAIKTMEVRGAPLIGATAAFGLVLAIIEKNDMPENKASSILADAVAGNNLSSEKPFTGRSNITALKKGMVIISRKRVNKFNSIDDSITLATTLPSTIVDVGEIVGTLKIIPFSAPKKLVNIALNAAKYPEPLISIKPFIFKKIMLIITRFSETKKSIIDKTIEEIKKRVINVNSQIESIEIINHDEYSITQTIQRIKKICRGSFWTNNYEFYFFFLI